VRLEREDGGGGVCERCEVADNALSRIVVGIAGDRFAPGASQGEGVRRAVLELLADEAASRGLKPGERVVLTEEEGD